MPVFRWFSSLFVRLAVAAMLMSAAAAPSQAQVTFGAFYPAAWSYYLALPFHYALSYAIAFPGHARLGGWLVAGSSPAGGLHGASRRLYQR